MDTVAHTLPRLAAGVRELGKPSWQPLLTYVAELHARSIRPAVAPLPHPWEEIGAGYCYGPAFGHWDLAHQLADSLVDEPEHVRRQLENLFTVQEADGLIGGSCYLRDGGTRLRWQRHEGHPPMWALVADDLLALHPDATLRAQALAVLERQIGWFERERAAEPFGFCYTDIVTGSYESGIDRGIRFAEVERGAMPGVDACAHVYALYDCAARWSAAEGQDPAAWIQRRDALGTQIQEELFSAESGFFHDWWLREPAAQRGAFEGMWPVVVGAATPAQAARVIHEHLLDARRFRSPHPIATVARDDLRRTTRMWQGPAWNSMTWWAARGCRRYGASAAAAELLAAALDHSAAIFADTGTIWEFYDADGGDPRRLGRKPDTDFDQPCPDYLGHNPLIAMARLWVECQAEA